MKIELRRAALTYQAPDGEVAALRDVTFGVADGEFVSIVGPSGCGKSTLVNLIPRFYEVSSGSIRVDGTDVRSYPVPQLRKKIGMVPQRAVLFSGTLRENMQWNKQDAGDEEIWQALRVAQAEEFVRKLPDGLDTRILQGGENLSGGQKQRVAIAGVIAMEPKCIVLDEPTAMLDPSGRKEVIRAVRGLNQVEGVTLILITHYMEEVVDADRVIVMDDGHIVMDGTPKEIFSRVEELKQYRMDVPQVTELAWELQKKGIPLPDGILRKSELLDALVPLLKEE